MTRLLVLLAVTAATALSTTASGQEAWRNQGASPRPPAAYYAAQRRAPMPPPASPGRHTIEDERYTPVSYESRPYEPYDQRVHADHLREDPRPYRRADYVRDEPPTRRMTDYGREDFGPYRRAEYGRHAPPPQRMAAYAPSVSAVSDVVSDACASCGDTGCDGGCGWNKAPHLDCDNVWSCDECSTCNECVGPCCCDSPFRHRTGIWAEYIYLRARDLEVAYAVETDGPPSPPENQGVQVGAAAVIEPNYLSAYRIGFTFALNDCASVVASFANFDSNEDSSISRTSTNDIRSLVSHPLVNNVADDWTDAQARTDIEFELVDLDFRWRYCCSSQHAINFLAGVRHARTEQAFNSQFFGNGFRNVNTNVEFRGEGLRVGLDIERHSRCHRLFVYGRGTASFVIGQFDAEYQQDSDADGMEVDTAWEAGRIVPILDLELGIGWQTCCGVLRNRQSGRLSAHAGEFWLSSDRLARIP